MAKSFDQYLAESGQQSKLDELRRTGQYDTARSQYESGGSYGSSNNLDFSSTLRRAQEMQREANKPVIDSFQASIPEIQSSYKTARETLEKRRAPLAARYDNLLAEIKGNQTTAENRQTVTTQNELGKRGILSSSGLAQQEMTNALNPITQQYTTLTKDAGLAREQGLQAIDEQVSGLTSEEVSALRNVRTAIAQAEATGNTNAVSIAQQQLAQAQAAAQAAREQASNEKMYNEITLPTAQANLKNIESEIAKRNKESTPTTNIQDFFNLFNPGGSSQSTTGSFSLGGNVISLLKKGNIDEALALAMNP